MGFENIEQVNPLPNIVQNEENIWKLLLGIGIFTILLGLCAIFLPLIATLTVEAVLAVVFIIASISHIIHAFKFPQPKGFSFRLIAGILYGFIGIMFLLFPVIGALTLTLLLAFLFIIVGAFKIALSLNLRPSKSWQWLMFSGVISIVLGVLIWAAMPGAARWVIGLLVGVELLFSGWAITAVAVSIKNEEKYHVEVRY